MYIIRITQCRDRGTGSLARVIAGAEVPRELLGDALGAGATPALFPGGYNPDTRRL